MAAMPDEQVNRKVEGLGKKTEELCREHGVYAPSLIAFAYMVEVAQNYLVDQLEPTPQDMASKG